jgi:phage shock protein A
MIYTKQWSLYTIAAMLLLCNEEGAMGFTHTSSFARRSATASVIQSASPPFGVSKSNHQRQAGSSAMQMNLFDRFARVTKGTLNDVLKNLEDPEKIMTQALEDMQNDLVKVRQSYAEITATQRRLMKQKEQAEAMANDWYSRAQLALQKGNEELAREALARRQAQVEIMEQVDQQINTQAAAIDKLYDGMQELENRIMEAKAKKDQFVARARTAQSTQKVNDMLNGMTGKTSMDAFTRMEEKVEALEASAEVSAEMSARALPGGTSLDKEFKLLEAESSVDDELKRMKGLLNPAQEMPGKGSSSGSAGSDASAPRSSEVDDEFAKLKKDAGL